jgi:hypothetical protein
MQIFRPRVVGNLFSEQIRYTPPGEKNEIQATVVAEQDMDHAKVIDSQGKVLSEGRLAHQKGVAEGNRETRVLLFIANNGGKEMQYVVREEYLGVHSVAA